MCPSLSLSLSLSLSMQHFLSLLWLLRWHCPHHFHCQYQCHYYCYFHYCLSSVHYGEDHFHIHFFIRSSNIWFSYRHWFVTSQAYYKPTYCNDQLPVGLFAQLVEHCSSIAEVMGSNYEVFSGLIFTIAFNFEDCFHIHFNFSVFVSPTDIVIDTVSVPVTVNIAVTFDSSTDSVAFSVHETDCLWLTELERRSVSWDVTVKDLEQRFKAFFWRNSPLARGKGRRGLKEHSFLEGVVFAEWMVLSGAYFLNNSTVLVTRYLE